MDDSSVKKLLKAAPAPPPSFLTKSLLPPPSGLSGLKNIPKPKPKSETEYFGLDTPWQVVYENPLAKISDLPIPSPYLEGVRAEEINRLRRFVITEAQSRWNIKINDDPVNRWLFEQLSVPLAEQDPLLVKDSILPAINSTSNSRSFSTEILNLLPTPLYISWRERQNPTNKSRDLIVNWCQAADKILSISKTHVETLSLIRQIAAEARNSRSNPITLITQLKEKCVPVLTKFYEPQVQTLFQQLIAEAKKSQEKINLKRNSIPSDDYSKVNVQLEAIVPLNPNAKLEEEKYQFRLYYQDQVLNLPPYHYRKLRKLYLGSDTYFAASLYCLLLRYQTFFGESGSAYHAAAPPDSFRVMRDYFGCQQENFASPFNCFFSRFNSAFLDIDGYFGSLGSFFDNIPLEGSFETGPPYVLEVMNSLANRLNFLLTNSKRPLSFIVFVPEWREPIADYHLIFEQSPFLRQQYLRAGGDYYYVRGNQQEISNTDELGRYFKLPFATRIYWLQNETGIVKYPITETGLAAFKASFDLNPNLKPSLPEEFKLSDFRSQQIISDNNNKEIKAFEITNKTVKKILKVIDEGSIYQYGSKERAAGEFVKAQSIPEFVYCGPAEALGAYALANACRAQGRIFTLFLSGQHLPPQGAAFQSNLSLQPFNPNVNTNKSTIYILPQKLEEVERIGKNYVEAQKDRRLLVPFGLNDTFYRQLLLTSISADFKNLVPKRVWLAVGSGTLLSVLLEIWTETQFHVVQVGKSVWLDALAKDPSKQLAIRERIIFYRAPEKFTDDCQIAPPYDSLMNYDAKVYRFALLFGESEDYIWNVASSFRRLNQFAADIFYNNKSNDNSLMERILTLINERIFYQDKPNLKTYTPDALYQLYLQAKIPVKSDSYSLSGTINANFKAKFSEIVKLVGPRIPTAKAIILDIGSSDGSTIVNVAKLLNLANSGALIYLNDIRQPAAIVATDDFTLRSLITTSQEPLNFEPASIDLITCFQVIHHMTSADWQQRLREFKQLLKVGGLLAITDHNCQNAEDKTVAAMQHMLYDLQDYPNKNMNREQFTDFIDLEKHYLSNTNYRSMTELITEITVAGFQLLGKYYSPLDNPTKVYQAVFLNI